MASTRPIIGVVLAGGGSTRMGKLNKAELVFENQRLIDRAVERLNPQVSQVVLSAPQNYGLDCAFIVDQVPPVGPLGGVHAALSYVVEHFPLAQAIVTVPVDAPFYPNDLVLRLYQSSLSGSCAVCAETEDGWQPTFCLWPVSILPELDALIKSGEAGSLKGFLKKNKAATVSYDDLKLFYNINSPEDLNKLL